MISGVDRIKYTPVRECPHLVEGIIDHGTVMKTAWFTVEPAKGDDNFLLTSVDDGSMFVASGDTMVNWLQPEDMNDPLVQAQLIVGLAEMGMEFE
jgi:hypothetical protein